MSVAKPLMTATSLAVAAMFGGGVYLMLNLGTYAEQITERVATKTLGVDVDIADMEIFLKERKAVVKGLTIANPDGFTKPYAMIADTISITLGSVSKELIEFKDIDVKGTQVNVEVKEKTTNLQTIKQGVKVRPPEATDTETKPLKVIIDRILLDGTQINPTVTLLSSADLKSAKVPTITVRDVGKKQNGVIVSQAVSEVWQQLSAQFARAAGSAGFYQGMSPEALKQLGQGQLDGLKNEINKGINDAAESFKSLFD